MSCPARSAKKRSRRQSQTYLGGKNSVLPLTSVIGIPSDVILPDDLDVGSHQYLEARAETYFVSGLGDPL